MDQLAIDVLKTTLYHRVPVAGEVTKETIRQLNDHAILALTADAISKYEAESGVQEEVEQALAHQMTSFAAYMSEQNKIMDALSQAGCTAAVLKGASAAMYYPEPGLRRMGDIDFMVFPRTEETFEKAREVLRGLGYKEDDRTVRHLEFRKGKLELEMHRYFSHRRNQNELLLDSIVDNSTQVERSFNSFGHYHFFSFSDEVNGLIFLDHISHHLHSGLGFRQIIDWLLYVDSVVSEEFWAGKLQPLAEKTGFEILAKTVTRMGELYLGAPSHTWCLEVDESICEQLFQMVNEAGNFGKNLDFKDKSTMTVLHEGISFKKLQQRGLKNWPAAKKHKILRPFAWIYQICRYIRKGLKRDKSSAGFVANYKEHRKQKQLFEKLGIPNEGENAAK
ncbi:MAG: nucleotidyltransferase family protein [Lachnospiraceae bacterium]|nr:nucleotidyltransferase family protein [Lachnospiraceae bacterium]